MKRMTILIGLVLTLMIFPASAQDRAAVPDITHLADYAPATAVGYMSVRGDAAYREQTNALFTRLEPILGNSGLEDFFTTFLNNAEIATFIGDSMALTVLSANASLDDLLSDDSPIGILFDINDTDAAHVFLNKSITTEPVDRGSWRVYEDGSAYAALSDTTLIVSPDRAYIEQIISGDYGKLSGDSSFLAAIQHLPETRYDVLGYIDLESIFTQLAPAADRISANAVAGLAGHLAIGALNEDGRNLLLDTAWHYGDLSGAGQYGFSPEILIAPAIDTNFAQNFSPDTLFYLQSTGLGGALAETFDLLNVLGALMESDASTTYFGLEPYINATSGDAAKSALSLALAAATGLNLDTDIIQALRGDFALYYGIEVKDEADNEYAPSFGILLTESEQSSRFTSAIVNILDRAGKPIKRIPLRGVGDMIDLSPITAPVIESEFHPDMRSGSELDIWFGIGSGLMALGTAPSVEFALTPGEKESLATTPQFRHAIESTMLEGASGLAYINGSTLYTYMNSPEELEAIESVSVSMRGDAEGFVARVAISLN